MPSIKMYNTMSRRIEDFRPLNPPKVRMYACGPTVYFYAHIGNMRAYVFEDLLRKLLMHEGYDVNHVMNLTDVGHLASDADTGEDKIRSEASKEHKSMPEIADFYTKAFMKDISRLNIMMPTTLAKASDHVNEMLSLIGTLDKEGYLYTIKDSGSGVYMDTSKVKDYGKLSGRTFEELNKGQQAGARVDRPEGLKNITDFAVWRFAPESLKEMVWDSKFGRGFPGWHIECSAMSMKYLGNTFDIHCGGIDHIPIHHTNEIAQSESATGATFVDYWFHVNFLTVDGEKMAKSVGNIYTLDDLVKKGFSPLAYRYFLLGSHYRSQQNFTFDALQNAQNTINSIYAVAQKLTKVSAKFDKLDKETIKFAENIRVKFFSAISNDFNTPEALAAMHELVSKAANLVETGSIGIDASSLILNVLLDFDSVLGISIDNYAKEKSLPAGAEELLKARDQARASKDFAKADELRKELEEKFGVVVEDAQDGSRWFLKVQ
ncbi:cysteine--tRNA ligase [Candidatus Marsarchaeota archaeon]|nr:cysteine--tRNA ligase [Candidatus Marsarchaeota archaeon]